MPATAAPARCASTATRCAPASCRWARRTAARSRPSRDWPALTLRVVRSPHPHARFTLGDLEGFTATHPGLVRVLTAADVPGSNVYGIYETGKDQPVLADGFVRYAGEAVLALVGDAGVVAAIRDEELPIAWVPLPALAGLD